MVQLRLRGCQRLTTRGAFRACNNTDALFCCRLVPRPCSPIPGYAIACCKVKAWEFMLANSRRTRARAHTHTHTHAHTHTHTHTHIHTHTNIHTQSQPDARAAAAVLGRVAAVGPVLPAAAAILRCRSSPSRPAAGYRDWMGCVPGVLQHEHLLCSLK
eukprot:367838-Pelagomonas_calceolata.AAC.1